MYCHTIPASQFHRSGPSVYVVWTDAHSTFCCHPGDDGCVGVRPTQTPASGDTQNSMWQMDDTENPIFAHFSSHFSTFSLVLFWNLFYAANANSLCGSLLSSKCHGGVRLYLPIILISLSFQSSTRNLEYVLSESMSGEVGADGVSFYLLHLSSFISFSPILGINPFHSFDPYILTLCLSVSRTLLSILLFGYIIYYNN